MSSSRNSLVAGPGQAPQSNYSQLLKALMGGGSLGTYQRGNYPVPSQAALGDLRLAQSMQQPGYGRNEGATWGNLVQAIAAPLIGRRREREARAELEAAYQSQGASADRADKIRRQRDREDKQWEWDNAPQVPQKDPLAQRRAHYEFLVSEHGMKPEDAMYHSGFTKRDEDQEGPSVDFVAVTNPDGSKSRVAVDEYGRPIEGLDPMQTAPAPKEEPNELTQAQDLKLQGEIDNAAEALTALRDYDTYLQGHGYEADIFGNKQDAGEAKGKYSLARNAIRNLYELGVLQKADLELLEESLADPTGLWGAATNWGGSRSEKDRNFLKTHIDMIEGRIGRLNQRRGNETPGGDIQSIIAEAKRATGNG